MTKSDGKCRVDSVVAGEISINMLGAYPTVLVKYALSNAQSGERFGAGLRPAGWSEETMEKLRELVASLERDVCTVVFDGHPSSSVVEDPLGTTDGVAGF